MSATDTMPGQTEVAPGPGETTGSCLCGAVGFAFSDTFGIFQYCFCSRCRKATGSAFAANMLVPPEAFRWTRGEDLVGTFPLADARHFATGFCKSCGSALPWRGQTGRAVVVPAGALDDVPPLRPGQNVHVASRAPWYAEPMELPSFDHLPPKKRG